MGRRPVYKIQDASWAEYEIRDTKHKMRGAAYKIRDTRYEIQRRGMRYDLPISETKCRAKKDAKKRARTTRPVRDGECLAPSRESRRA